MHSVVFLSSPSEPRWASVNRGVLICDECCSVHRSLGRHSSQVRHLTHTPWPSTQLQVITPYRKNVYLCKVCAKLRVFYILSFSEAEPFLLKCPEITLSLHTVSRFKVSRALSLLEFNLLTTVVHQIPLRHIDFCPNIESVCSGREPFTASQRSPL